MSINAVFLDKDGTLIENIPYNVDPRHMAFTPGAREGLKLLHAMGYRLVVVSNQSGVARGYFSERALDAVEARLREMLDEIEVPLAGFYYCPHHPEGVLPEYAIACECRKPEPGLLTRAMAAHNIDVSKSWLIGDILNDIEAGRRVGCKTILIDNGNETEWLLNRQRMPHHLVTDLSEAARVIMAIGKVTRDDIGYPLLVKIEGDK